MTYRQFFKMYVFEDSTPYEEGYMARDFGFSKKDCPYRKDSVYHYPWMNGFHHAGEMNHGN